MGEIAQEPSCGLFKERVRSIYLDGLKWKTTKKDGTPPIFDPRTTQFFLSKEIFISYTHEQRKHRAQQWSKSYYEASQDPVQHLSRLDRTIASLLLCHFDGNLDEDVVVTETCDLLSRLPATPHLPATKHS